jgi:hypothetical protein
LCVKNTNNYKKHKYTVACEKTPEIFGYQIGGCLVCEKWLKDRKDRKLSLDDIKHYCNIVTAIRKTLEIQKIADSIYPKLEDDIINNI